MTKTNLWLCLLLAFLCCTSPVHAESPAADEEMQTLRMFYRDSDLVVTPSRTPKPISQVAENITIVTRKEIEAINAHTLADILNIIPGVQMDLRGGPGTQADPYIQGSDPRHVLVMIDGVSQNNLASNSADIGAIPVQQIERVEIIKGPASSAWGSSLGGIVNIITKNPVEDKKGSGTVSASIGERNTGDYRGEAAGALGKFGYYLSAGKLLSDGLTKNTAVDKENFYTKLQWNLEDQGNLRFTLGYDKGERGTGEFTLLDFSFRDDFAYLFSTLSLSYALTDRLDLDLSLRGATRDLDQSQKNLGTGVESVSTFRDKDYGGSAKVTWRQGMHQLLAGTDFDRGELTSNSITGSEHEIDKWAAFANDSIVIARFTLTPGIRYDYTSTNGDFVSPSLGATYKLGDHTIIRGYVAQGFSTPPFSATFGSDQQGLQPNPALKVEKVLSYQAGVESTFLKYLWLKTTLFRHDITDVLTRASLPSGKRIAENSGKQLRQGVEVEAKTVPWHHTSLAAGFAFVAAEDRDTGKTIMDIPRYTYDIGLHYDDDAVGKGALTGHYIWWNADPIVIGGSTTTGKYSAFVWDLNLSKKIYTQDAVAVEAFFTAHNLFNDAQYHYGFFQNPGRWLEGGVRFKF